MLPSMSVPVGSVHYLEIVTPEVEATRTLHAEVHGVSFRAPEPALGNAVVAELKNGSLLGIRAPLHESETAIVRAYLRVADLAVAVARAEKGGAKIALPATELPGHGTIAITVQGGVQHGLWQLP